MGIPKIDRKLVICECSSSEHQVIFSRFDGETEVYVDFHLIEPRGFWSRLRLALKYMFRESAPHGHFDTIVLGQENVDELTEWLQNGKDKGTA